MASGLVRFVLEDVPAVLVVIANRPANVNDGSVASPRQPARSAVDIERSGGHRTAGQPMHSV